MTSKQKQLVRQTWEQIVPISEAAAELFYRRLFELDATLKPLFRTNMKAQGEKLMHMIGVSVKNLDRLDDILHAVDTLGRRHVAYGVKEKDYDTVADALLWTLERGLGDTFTPEVEAAWVAVYNVLATRMKTASAQLAPCKTSSWGGFSEIPKPHHD